MLTWRDRNHSVRVSAKGIQEIDSSNRNKVGSWCQPSKFHRVVTKVNLSYQDFGRSDEGQESSPKREFVQRVDHRELAGARVAAELAPLGV